MNIFFLHLDPRVNASYYCDKHVIKIILEIAQMLWTAYGNQPMDLPATIKRYKPTHRNHPMTLWVGSSKANFLYACQLGLALCREYTDRYGKTHACEAIIVFLQRHTPQQFKFQKSPKAIYAQTDNPPQTSPVPLCMDVKFHASSLIDSYRSYYKQSKRDLCTWKYSTRPYWFE